MNVDDRGLPARVADVDVNLVQADGKVRIPLEEILDIEGRLELQRVERADGSDHQRGGKDHSTLAGERDDYGRQPGAMLMSGAGLRDLHWGIADVVSVLAALRVSVPTGVEAHEDGRQGEAKDDERGEDGESSADAEADDGLDLCRNVG